MKFDIGSCPAFAFITVISPFRQLIDRWSQYLSVDDLAMVTRKKASYMSNVLECCWRNIAKTVHCSRIALRL